MKFKNILGLLRFNKKKTFIINFIFQLLYMGVLVITPLISENFIDSVVEKSFDRVVLFIVLVLVTYVVGQLAAYAVDVFEGISEKEIWEKIIVKVSDHCRFYDHRVKELKVEDVQQELGQNYELIKKFLHHTLFRW